MSEPTPSRMSKFAYDVAVQAIGSALGVLIVAIAALASGLIQAPENLSVVRVVLKLTGSAVGMSSTFYLLRAIWEDTKSRRGGNGKPLDPVSRRFAVPVVLMIVSALTLLAVGPSGDR